MAKAADTKQFEAAIAPVIAFNKLVVKNAEAAFNMQFESMKAIADMNMKNINDYLEVRSADDFKAYAEKQKDVAQEMTARVTSDIKAFGELNSKFFEDARVLTEENVKATVAQAKAA